MFKLFINPKHKISHINPELQGHFSEHLADVFMRVFMLAKTATFRIQTV